MFSEPYIVKFKFNVKNLDLNQNYLWIYFNGEPKKFNPEIEILVNSDNIEFDIRHFNPGLYLSKQAHIQNHAVINSITVDDFWVFRPPFLHNIVVYDQDYLAHVKIHGQGWETQLNKNCQSFHFNGRLRFNFKFPTIRNFS